jgi:bacteriocin biosynthesis cyclodehydratase domain-containing protein
MDGVARFSPAKPIMLRRPQFKPHFRIEFVDGAGILLLSEHSHSVLKGRLYQLVVPLIDGHRSVNDIVEQLRDQTDPAKVYYALARLEGKGCLAECEETLPSAEAALWAIQNIAPHAAVRQLANTRVSVTAVGEVATEPFAAILESLHVQVSEGGQLGVILTDDYLRSGLHSYNQEALRSGRPWLLVKPVGSQIWIGPLFWPGKTGCWACLAQRLRANRTVEMFVQKKQGRAEPVPTARAFTPATLQIAWNIAATEIATWIVRGESPNLEGKILTFDLRSCQTQTHTLVRQSLCVACGRPEQGGHGPAPPVVLQSRKKAFTEDGGHRVYRPEATLERYQHHVSPLIGAVTMLERPVSAGDGPLHVYAAGENQAVRHESLEDVRRSLRSMSCGKGVSDLQARVSALCEALERASGVFRGDERRRKARLRDLEDVAIHPNRVMLYSARQYEERDAWNARKSPWTHVPVPFDEEAEIEWTPVWSLTRQAIRYLPTALCYYEYPQPKDRAYCMACSNGNAAGNTPEEAILQGFLELVERDGVGVWWYNRLQRPGVDLDSFDEPYLHQVSAFLKERKRDLWVLDLTTDLQIPIFAALSRRTDGLSEQILIGFGAHLEARVAVLRAVTELNQMLAWVLSSESQKTSTEGINDRETMHWLETATLANQLYLVPDAVTAPRIASDFPWQCTDDLRHDVLACQALVERHSMEMLVLDQTRQDFGLPVVKVIVPGLRHFWARYAPGRLFEVPARLGWLPRPLSEDQFNPIPMFL